jgi:hypothetical protein
MELFLVSFELLSAKEPRYCTDYGFRVSYYISIIGIVCHLCFDEWMGYVLFICCNWCWEGIGMMEGRQFVSTGIKTLFLPVHTGRLGEWLFFYNPIVMNATCERIHITV